MPITREADMLKEITSDQSIDSMERETSKNDYGDKYSKN